MLKTRREFVRSAFAVLGGGMARAVFAQSSGVAAWISSLFRKEIKTMRNVRAACQDPQFAAAMLTGRVPRNVLEMDPNPSPEIHSSQVAADGRKALREQFSADLRSVLSRETNPAEATDEIEKLVTQLLSSVGDIHRAEITYLTSKPAASAEAVANPASVTESARARRQHGYDDLRHAARALMGR